MAYTILTYQDVADELNSDYRTVLHATATDVGVSVITTCRADLYRLASSIEFCRVLKSRKNMTVTVTDCGVICIR